MRIKIIGDNNCARATRHLLRKAGFAVTEFLPADVVTDAPHFGYAITIDLAPAPHPYSSREPGSSTHGHSSGNEEASSFAKATADLSSLATGGAGLPAVGLAEAGASLPTPACIHFDSVDSELEAAILRHVTQLAVAPVVVDRPGGVVHSERELRIVVPNTGDAKADEAAAVAVEFGVLRGLLDLCSPPSASGSRGKLPGTTVTVNKVRSQNGKKWWHKVFSRVALGMKNATTELFNRKCLFGTSGVKTPEGDSGLMSWLKPRPTKIFRATRIVGARTIVEDMEIVGTRRIVGDTEIVGAGASWILSLARRVRAASAFSLASRRDRVSHSSQLDGQRRRRDAGATRGWNLGCALRLAFCAIAVLAIAGGLRAAPRPALSRDLFSTKPVPAALGVVGGSRATDRGAYLPAAALPPQGQFSTGQAPVKITDGTNTLVVDPCKGQTKLYVSINQTANTQLAAGTAAKKIYVCSIHVVVAVATSVALVEGTGAVCATGTAGVSGFGGATAATGWNFAVNGGIVLGNGDAAVGAEGTSADNLCLFNSGSGQVSGGISYVVQ